MVSWNTSERTWVATQYEEVQAILRDPRFSVDRRRANRYQAVAKFSLVERSRVDARGARDPVTEVVGPMFLLLDPPAHDRLRRVVAPAFSLQSVQASEGIIRDEVDRSVSALQAKLSEHGRADLVAEVADRVPLAVISRMLGIHWQDLQRLRPWAGDLAGVLDLGLFPKRLRQARDSGARLAQHLLPVLRDDPPWSASALELLQHGVDDGTLSQHEAVGTAALLLVGGFETTSGSLSASLLRLLKEPERLDELDSMARDPSAIADELIRVVSSVQTTVRIACERVSLGTDTIREGDLIAVSIASANHDPTVFDDPERVNCQRNRARPLSFGFGMHHCLGMHLARLEVAIVLEALQPLIPKLQLANDGFTWRPRNALSGLESLIVKWRP